MLVNFLYTRITIEYFCKQNIKFFMPISILEWICLVFTTMYSKVYNILLISTSLTQKKIIFFLAFTEYDK